MTWLSAAPWLIALVGVVGGGAFGGIERMNYLEEKSAHAADVAEAQKIVLKAKTEDAVRTKTLEDAYASEISNLKEKARARDIAITQAPPTAACAVSPAMRALFDGLRARHGEADAGQSGPAGGAGEAVSR